MKKDGLLIPRNCPQAMPATLPVWKKNCFFVTKAGNECGWTLGYKKNLPLYCPPLCMILIVAKFHVRAIWGEHYIDIIYGYHSIHGLDKHQFWFVTMNTYRWRCGKICKNLSQQSLCDASGFDASPGASTEPGFEMGCHVEPAHPRIVKSIELSWADLGLA